jgi:hypothetical protein
MDYSELVKSIPVERRKILADGLVDIILKSKNTDKMPSDLANIILHQWQQNLLTSQSGLSALLGAAALLEPEKTSSVLEDLQLDEIAKKIEEETLKAVG